MKIIQMMQLAALANHQSALRAGAGLALPQILADELVIADALPEIPPAVAELVFEFIEMSGRRRIGVHPPFLLIGELITNNDILKKPKTSRGG